MEKKLEALVKYQFEFRQKIETKTFSLEFSDYQDSDARENNIDFSVEYLSKKLCFGLRSRWNK